MPKKTVPAKKRKTSRTRAKKPKVKLAKNKLSGKIFCNDILQTSSINPRITYGNQNLKMKFACYRTFGLSLVYKFGGYKEEERKKVDTTRFKK